MTNNTIQNTNQQPLNIPAAILALNLPSWMPRRVNQTVAKLSDGTIKMFAYLVLLHDPKPHPLICVAEPENQLYPKLLAELAEEFRDYARRGGQVFVSTHSPDFLNATELDEVFWLVKKDGYTAIQRAADDAQVADYMRAGDQIGYLWKQGFFVGADPQ